MAPSRPPFFIKLQGSYHNPRHDFHKVTAPKALQPFGVAKSLTRLEPPVCVKELTIWFRAPPGCLGRIHGVCFEAFER